MVHPALCDPVGHHGGRFSIYQTQKNGWPSAAVEHHLGENGGHGWD